MVFLGCKNIFTYCCIKYNFDGFFFVKGISVRINPFAKNTSGEGVDLGTGGTGETEMSADFFCDPEDNLENSAKNAALLERYKAIKSQQQINNKKSSAGSSPSRQITTGPNPNNSSNSNNEYFEDFYLANSNMAGDFSGGDSDTENEEYEEDDDEDLNSEYTEENFDFDDTQSQNTEITLLKETSLINGSISSIDNEANLVANQPRSRLFNFFSRFLTIFFFMSLKIFEIKN